MTALELADLALDATRELSEARRERDAWRLVAVQAIHLAHTEQAERGRVENRYHRFLREQRGIDREAIARAAAEDEAQSEAVAA